MSRSSVVDHCSSPRRWLLPHVSNVSPSSKLLVILCFYVFFRWYPVFPVCDIVQFMVYDLGNLCVFVVHVSPRHTFFVGLPFGFRGSFVALLSCVLKMKQGDDCAYRNKVYKTMDGV